MEQEKSLKDLRRMALTMKRTVELINAWSSFLETDDTTPQEDQADAALNDLLRTVKREDLLEEVVTSLLTILVDAGDPEKVQAFLDLAADDLQKEVKRVRGY